MDQYSAWIVSAYITALLGAMWRSQGNTSKEIKTLLGELTEKEHQCQLRNSERFGAIERIVEKIVTIQAENIRKHERAEASFTEIRKRIDDVCVGDGK